MLETIWESRWLPDYKKRIPCINYVRYQGGVAQLGEHLPCKQGVKSSNLSVSTLGEISYYSSIAQLVEHSAVNRVVVGSSPTWGVYPKTSGCGSVWLEHLVWDQGVAGSNPLFSTMIGRRVGRDCVASEA